MIYVGIGDIHGHRDQFTQLMRNLRAEVDFNTATFVFLGDYVDGQSVNGDVIDVRNLVDDLMGYATKYPHWIFLKGNHEDMMLDALVFKSRRYHDYYQWYNQGGKQTAESYFPSGLTAYQKALVSPKDYIPADHLDWLNDRPLIHETDDFIFVHAGLFPGVPVENNDEMDMLWLREAFFTSDYDWGKRVIFGHTYFEIPLIKKNMIGINNISRTKGCLTAVILDSEYPDTYTFVTPFEETTAAWRQL